MRTLKLNYFHLFVLSDVLFPNFFQLIVVTDGCCSLWLGHVSWIFCSLISDISKDVVKAFFFHLLHKTFQIFFFKVILQMLWMLHLHENSFQISLLETGNSLSCFTLQVCFYIYLQFSLQPTTLGKLCCIILYETLTACHSYYISTYISIQLLKILGSIFFMCSYNSWNCTCN